MGEIWGIILAAGESKRMHSPKMLLPWNGRTIIESVVENVGASLIDGSVIVLGSCSEQIQKVTGHLAVNHVFNNNFTEGMLSSVQCGFRSLEDKVSAAIIFLGDQPAIRKEIINLLIEAYRKSGKGIIMPVFKGRRGHPLLVDTRYRNDILKLDPQTGLKTLQMSFPSDVLEVETDDNFVLKDIDTRKDYHDMLNQITKNNGRDYSIYP